MKINNFSDTITFESLTEDTQKKAIRYKTAGKYKLIQCDIKDGPFTRQVWEIEDSKGNVIHTTRNPFFGEGLLRALASGKVKPNNIPDSLPNKKSPGWEHDIPWTEIVNESFHDYDGQSFGFWITDTGQELPTTWPNIHHSDIANQHFPKPEQHDDVWNSIQVATKSGWIRVTMFPPSVMKRNPVGIDLIPNTVTLAALRKLYAKIKATDRNEFWFEDSNAPIDYKACLDKIHKLIRKTKHRQMALAESKLENQYNGCWIKSDGTVLPVKEGFSHVMIATEYFYEEGETSFKYSSLRALDAGWVRVSIWGESVCVDYKSPNLRTLRALAQYLKQNLVRWDVVFNRIDGRLTELHSQRGVLQFINSLNDIKEQRVYEIFNTTGLSWVKEGTEILAKASVNGREYSFSFLRDSGGGHAYEFSFGPTDTGDIHNTGDGGGHAPKIFGLAIKAIEEFISKYKPFMLWFFGAAPTKRNALYEKMAKMLASRLVATGYYLETKAVKGHFRTGTVFSLYREKPKLEESVIRLSDNIVAYHNPTVRQIDALCLNSKYQLLRGVIYYENEDWNLVVVDGFKINHDDIVDDLGLDYHKNDVNLVVVQSEIPEFVNEYNPWKWFQLSDDLYVAINSNLRQSVVARQPYMEKFFPDATVVAEKKAVTESVTTYNIQARYNEFNRRFFENKLPEIPLEIKPLKGLGGCVTCKVRRHGPQPKNQREKLFAIKTGQLTGSVIPGTMKLQLSNMYDNTPEHYDAVLLHEMIHVYFFMVGDVDENHGPKFLAMKKKISQLSGIDVPLTEKISKDVKLNVDNRAVTLIVLPVNGGKKHAYAIMHEPTVIKNLDYFNNRYGGDYQTGTLYRVTSELWTKKSVSGKVQRKERPDFYFMSDEDYDDLQKNGEILLKFNKDEKPVLNEHIVRGKHDLIYFVDPTFRQIEALCQNSKEEILRGTAFRPRDSQRWHALVIDANEANHSMIHNTIELNFSVSMLMPNTMCDFVVYRDSKVLEKEIPEYTMKHLEIYKAGSLYFTIRNHVIMDNISDPYLSGIFKNAQHIDNKVEPYALSEDITNDDVHKFGDKTRLNLGLVTFDMWLNQLGDIRLKMIEVSRDNRKQGLGTKAMQLLTDYADKHNKRIVLSPAQRDPYKGTTGRNRLIRFYKRFGFKLNRGRNKDFAVSDAMIRDPKG